MRAEKRNTHGLGGWNVSIQWITKTPISLAEPEAVVVASLKIIT